MRAAAAETRTVVVVVEATAGYTRKEAGDAENEVEKESTRPASATSSAPAIS